MRLGRFSVVCAIFAFFSASGAWGYRIWGYYPWWLQERWQKTDTSSFDQMLFFEIPIKSDGTLAPESGWPGKWEDFRATLKNRGLGISPTFTLFDQAAFESLFSNEARRARLRDALIFHLDEVRASGVQFDIEFFNKLSPESVKGFKRFIKDFSVAMKARGKILSLFVTAQDQAGLYDGELLSCFDYLVLQGYDAHWRTSPRTGPVAELGGGSPESWEAILQRYLALGAKREKILMSVPYFGYEWPAKDDKPGSATRGEGKEISYAPLPRSLVPAVVASALERVKKYGLRRDPLTSSPYYAYQGKDGWYQGWFEDEESLGKKFAYVGAEGLAGVAVFPVGYDGGNFDPLIGKYQKLK